MKIVIENPPKSEEEVVTFRVHQMSEKVLRALEELTRPDDLTVQSGNQSLKLALDEVFYVESVDFKTFVYGESAVFQSKLRLYEIEEALTEPTFLKVSRQVTLNVGKIRSVAAAGGGRIEATLTNGDKVMVSRQYAPALKARFGL